MNLQLFAAEAVHGKKLVYLYRIAEEEATADAVALAFVTENERTKSKDSDSVATKDGAIVTPGEIEQEISSTSILSTDSTMPDKLEEALDESKLIEVWEVNLAKPVEGQDGKYAGTYFQGYVTEVGVSSSSEDHVELSHTFAINGKGAKGEVTISAEQQSVIDYVFKDTKKTGA